MRAVRRDAIDGAAAFHPIWIVDFPMFEYDLASASGCRRTIRLPRRTKPTWRTW